MSTSEYPASRFEQPSRPRLRSAAGVRAITADVWVLWSLIAVAAVIRILVIDNQSLWTDEALTAFEAHLSFGSMIGQVAHVETTPPLYFILVWGVTKVFGPGQIALRSISALAGVALVPIAYLSARELVSRWAGVLAAALVALNPFLIWYSQEARAYMLLALLSGASFLWFARALRDPSRRNLSWWAVCSSLAVMTHFFAGFAVAPEALWLLWAARTRATVLAVGVVVVAQVAMAPFAFFDAGHGTGWIARIPPLNRISMMAFSWGASNLYHRGTQTEGLIAGGAFLVILAVLLLFGGDRQTRRGAKVGVVITGFVILVPLALRLVGQDYFYARNEIPAFVPLITVVAAACFAPRMRLLGAALAIALLALFGVATLRVQTHRYLQRPDWRTAAHALGPATVPRAILTVEGGMADPLKIYLPGVSWVQQPARRTLIREIDVIGVIQRVKLVPAPRVSKRAGRRRRTVHVARRSSLPVGVAVPKKSAPPGTRLVSRFRVDSWVVARFALVHPERLSAERLQALASRFFGRAPHSLLVLTQPRSPDGR